MLRQRTIREKARCVGIGLHSGRHITVEFLPALDDSGIVFVRTDLPQHPELRACIEHVADTTLATTLSVGRGQNTASVGTVEHLLAALMGLGIDNVRVLLDGPEVPILDGSAGPFVDLLLAAGVERQRCPKKFLVIKKEIEVRDGNKIARVSPSSRLQITCSLDFDHPLISPTPFRFHFSERAFLQEVSRARTFGFMQDVAALQKRGLALGGSLDNAIVIDDYRVLNTQGLRYSDEFVRHKVLDAIGDMALFGMPIVGSVRLHLSGHALNCQLVDAVLQDPKAYEIVQPPRAELEKLASAESSVFDLFAAFESMTQPCNNFTVRA